MSATLRLLGAGWRLIRADALLPPTVRIAAVALRLLAGPEAKAGRPGERLALAFEKLGPAASSRSPREIARTLEE